MFSMVRSKMTVGEPILDVPPSNLPPPCIRIRRVTSTVGLAHWTLTFDLCGTLIGDMKQLLAWIRGNMLKERPELFMQGDTV